MLSSLRLPLIATTLVVAVALCVSGLADRARKGATGPVAIEKGPRPDGPAEYVEWRNRSLRDEYGQLSDNGLMVAKAHVDMMRRLPEPPSAAGITRGSWSAIGPGNIGGRVRSIVIHPTDTDTMFIGSVAGGIWTTVNGGASWSPVDDFVANLAVSAIVMTPGNPDQMFAATGEGFYNSDGIRGAGIFRSLDGGTTWVQLPATSTSPGGGQSASDYYYTNELAISPAGTTLLVATRSGIFRSIDNGASFTRATMVGGAAINVGNGVVEVDFHPTDSTRAVAATFKGSALYSTDGGATWTFASGMPGTINTNFMRSELAYAPTNGNIVYAGVDLDQGSLYKSTDGGQSYVEIFDGLADTSVNPYANQGWYDNLLFVSPTDENFLVWGGLDLWRSSTGGSSWSQMSRWQSQFNSGPTSAHADHHIAVAHPTFNGTSNRIVFFGTDGGVYRAADVGTVGGGASPYQSGWTELNNGLGITQFYGGAGHPATGRITGGTQDNGTLFYNPGTANPAENWSRPFGGDGGFSAYDSSDVNYFYGEYVYAQIHRNATGGAGGSAYIYNGLTDANNSSAAEFIAAFIKDPNENNRLLVGAVRLWRSNNAKAVAPSWEVIKADVGGGAISAVAVAPGDSATIYAGHNSGRLYKTTVGTSAAATVMANWATIDDNSGSNPLPNRRITRITVDPSNNDVVYVTFGGFSGDNIYKSANGGASWTDVTGLGGGLTALPDVPVRDLEIHPSNSNWIYAGTEVGIFASENGGATWALPNDGPSNVSVDELFILGTTLYAVTHGRGMFAAPITPPPPPSAINDSYATSLNTPLAVAAPGVLGNDNGHGSTMTALLVTNVSNGALLLGADGGFNYTPNTGFAGADSFTYRAVTGAGQSNTATVTITVAAAPPTAQPPTGLYASAIVGNQVTLRWTPPATGLAPTNYVLEGGINPGEALASVPTGGTSPIFTFIAPSGAFYVRIHTLAGVERSAPSNEIRIFVNVPAVPSAASHLLGMVDGSSLALSWRNTFGGGAPTSILLDVTGSINATLPLPLADTFTFATVPGGTYTLSLRAMTGAGTSPSSNAVTLTFPGPCSGVPQVPANFLATKAGSVISVLWDSPDSGPATTGFVLVVSGAFNGSIPTTLRSLSGAVGSGSYTLSVYGTNPCGNGPATTPQTVTVP
jgi:Big-like domain-containing protein